jgi:cytochrome P450
VFSSGRGTLLTDGRARDAGGPHMPGARHLMRSDPPGHTLLRKVVSRSFTPLTTYVIAELMGVPRERWAEFWTWTDAAIMQVDAGRDDPGIALLSEHPDQRGLLIDEPALLPNAVEEMLRVTSPVLAFCRTARDGTEIRGQQIAAGDYVAMLYASANRDEEIWPDPDRFDVLRRQERPHLAFGFGPHVCLGANLARMEARVLFDELLRTFPDFQVTGPAVRGRPTLVAMVSEIPAAFGSRDPARARV